MKRTAEVVDLTICEDVVSNELQFRSGAIRMIQSSQAPKDPKKVSFDEILATRGLEKAILTTYVLEEEWIIPKLRSVPSVFICMDGGRQQSSHTAKSGNVTFVYPKFPKFPNYGVMHCKLMLLWYPSYLRIVISSGNLVSYDYDEVQNIVFIQDLERQDDIDSSTCNFLKELIGLTDHLGLWKIAFTVDEINKYDWDEIRVKLVYSIPGMNSNSNGHRTGLFMLKDQISQLRVNPMKTIECQGSSVGNLGSAWINDFISSAQGQSPHVNKENPSKLKLIFPTMSYVLKSPMGPGAFGTIFCQESNWKSSVAGIFYQCKSSFGNGQPLHTKIISAIGEEDEPIWYYIGSANFTASAWGRFVKEHSSILIANYEVGILFRAEDEEDLCNGQFPFPYQRPPAPYSNLDKPWMQNSIY